MTNEEKSKLITKLMDLNEQLARDYDKQSENTELTDESLRKLGERVKYNEGARFCIRYVVDYIMNEVE